MGTQKHTGERSAMENNWATSYQLGEECRALKLHPKAQPWGPSITLQVSSFPAAITISPGTKLDSDPLLPQAYKHT